MSVKLLPPGGGSAPTQEFSVGQSTALTYTPARGASILINPHHPAHQLDALVPSAPAPPHLPASLFGLSEAKVSILGEGIASGSTLLITVDYLEGQERLSAKEILGAIPALVEGARNSGFETLQVVAVFANEELARVVERLVKRANGQFASGGPCDTITFTL